ncbi:hypothetical protein GPJ56_005559 [Histomonas meleagridis]|uniref:uncharacterized protein n=1 Tax=Histomonas meleagridis TaxID=135588 RepID=UPI003559B67C|nr:hypothetical protein GPJ56_005559 [Histomonas meleagridis]KAH0799611.1 hypothetical protein GO595_007679 [Histomonas meleagridis]
MSDNNTIASEFIAAYYYKLTYVPNDIQKFYNQEKATIWRQSMESSNAIPFKDAKNLLVPTITKGSKVSVLEYNILNVENGFILNVFGKIEEGETARKFVQTFFIEIVKAEDVSRICIISDSLKYESTKEEEEALQLTEVRPKKQYKKKPTPNKFVYKAD